MRRRSTAPNLWRSARRAVGPLAAGALAALLAAGVWWADVPPVGEALGAPAPTEVVAATTPTTTVVVEPPPTVAVTLIPTTAPPAPPPAVFSPHPTPAPPTTTPPTSAPRAKTPTPLPVAPPTVRLTAPAVRAALDLAPGDPLASTVLVDAKGCRPQVGSAGSGVVLAPGLVMTNAHVVAGQREITVIGVDGRAHPATVVGFDPAVDLAALQVSGLDAAPLPLSQAYEGETGRIAGHPGGGTLSIATFVVGAIGPVAGTDIYGVPTPPRTVIRGRAPVEHGDSGAPLLMSDGTVGGILYAASSNDQGEAWVVTASDVSTFLGGVAGGGGRPVGTGDRCLL